MPVTALAPVTVAETVYVPGPSLGTTKVQSKSPPCKFVPVYWLVQVWVAGVLPSNVKVVTGASEYEKPTPPTLTVIPAGPEFGTRSRCVPAPPPPPPQSEQGCKEWATGMELTITTALAMKRVTTRRAL